MRDDDCGYDDYIGPPLTRKERAWVRRLKKVMDDRPDTLWLFNTGSMLVMRRGPGDEQVLLANGGVDPAWRVTMVSQGGSEGGGW